MPKCRSQGWKKNCRTQTHGEGPKFHLIL